MAISMQHWNGDQLCVIDTETTGLEPGWHEIVQICIIALDSEIKPRKDIAPFYLEIKPNHPERASKDAMRINKLSLEKLEKAPTQEAVAAMFIQWVKTLKLPYTSYGTPKRIIPLGQNYSFDKSFIEKWLGPGVYNDYISYHVRDTKVSAVYLNDLAAMHGENVPFPLTSLKNLTKYQKIEYNRAHDALEDCVATAQVYERFLRRGGLI